jgi:hypothetical protein
MKLGDRVAVCYDGKVSRAVEGVVTGTKQNTHIRVRFNTWLDNETVETWFPRRARPSRYGGKRYTFAKFVQVNDSLMDKLFDAPGDWYGVYKVGDLDPHYQAVMRENGERFV